MSLASRIFSRAWIVVLVLACGFLAWANYRRAQRVEYVSSLARTPPGASATPAPTLPELIVPERNEASFHLLAQTAAMLAHREWRIRRVDYDNAPSGREVHATSPYRWGLGLAAAIDRVWRGGTVESAVERAALYFEPLVHGLLVVGVTVFVAWQFGPLAAVLIAVGCVTFFPFAAGFLPGVPDEHGLARALSFGSALLLLTGLRDRRAAGPWFAIAGVCGGLGLWINVATQLPVLVGEFLGALVAAATARVVCIRENAAEEVSLPWTAWAVAGAATTLAGYLCEYWPGQLGSWRIEWIHPIYGVSWIGAGLLLRSVEEWSNGRRIAWKLPHLAVVGTATFCALAAPVAIFQLGRGGWIAGDASAFRLSDQPVGVVASSTWAWLLRDGLGVTAWATLLPLVVIGPTVWLLWRRATPPRSRVMIAFALGPVLIGLWIAARQLQGWHMLDAMLLVMMVAAVPPVGSGWRADAMVWAALVTVIAIPGAMRVMPTGFVASKVILTPSETQELIERDLAHWLARHAPEPRAIVFSPPREALTLSYYGGLRAIGTFDPDNRPGFAATLMLTGAMTMVEVQAAIQARGIRYVVIPSWDRFFDNFAQLYLVASFSHRVSFFIDELRRWRLPDWLRPVAYQMPAIPGFENESVLVFEVVDEQRPAAAASRLTDYLIETGRIDQAIASSATLRRFPADVGALAAQAEVLLARDDRAGFAGMIKVLQTRLATGADRYLPWDRRVSLATVLAEGNELDLARQQLQRCLVEVDADRLRTLSPGSLYRLLVLSHAFHEEIADAKLSELALELLPAELRAQL